MMKWINKKRNKKGFTLVELVVVIAILGILAAIAVPKLSSSRENASIAAHNANVRTLESSATLAVSEGSKPVIWKDGDEGFREDGEKDGKKGWGNYLQSWPIVPSGVQGGEFTGETVNESGVVTVGDLKILADEGYKVEIKEKGIIIVTPGKINSTKKDK